MLLRKNLEVHRLEVYTERGVVKGGVAGDVTYMIDCETKKPSRADVEKVCCNRVASPQFGMCVRNLTLASVLAGLDIAAAASARDLVLSQCDAARLAEEYDSAMNTSSLRSTARVFPREVFAWALMAIDEHDVARMHPSGTPDTAVQVLRRSNCRMSRRSSTSRVNQFCYSWICVWHDQRISVLLGSLNRMVGQTCWCKTLMDKLPMFKMTQCDP